MMFLRRQFPSTELDIAFLKRELNRMGTDGRQWELREDTQKIEVLCRVWGVWAVRPLLVYVKDSHLLYTRADRLKSFTLMGLLLLLMLWLVYYSGSVLVTMAAICLSPMAFGVLSWLNFLAVRDDFTRFGEMIEQYRKPTTTDE